MADFASARGQRVLEIWVGMGAVGEPAGGRHAARSIIRVSSETVVRTRVITIVLSCTFSTIAITGRLRDGLA